MFFMFENARRKRIEEAIANCNPTCGKKGLKLVDDLCGRSSKTGKNLSYPQSGQLKTYPFSHRAFSKDLPLKIKPCSKPLFLHRGCLSNNTGFT